MAKKKPTIEYKLPHQRKPPKEVEPWTTIKGKQPKEVKHLPIQLWKRPEVGPWTIHPRKRPEVEPPIRKRVKPLSELPPEGFTKFERVRRKPITSEEAYEELLHGKKSPLPLRKKKEPSTIVNIKQPIAGRRKGGPVPPPPYTPAKPAPRRSPKLKWNIKKR